MNEQLLELIRLSGEAGYQVQSIKSKKAHLKEVEYLSTVANGKPIGRDIVLRISPIGKPKAEVGVRAGTAQADLDDGGGDKQRPIVEALEHINRNLNALNKLIKHIALSVGSQYQNRLGGCGGPGGNGIAEPGPGKTA
jgi:hypothetical protein